MKKWLRIAVIAVAIAAAALILLQFGLSPSGNPSPAPGQAGTANSPPVNSGLAPVEVSGPVPASSYGAGAVGTRTATSVVLSAPISSAELGTLIGQAKPAPGSGAHPNFTAIKAALYDPITNKLLASMTLGVDGSYKFIVEPGEYVLNTIPTGRSGQLPQRIAIAMGQVVNINFFIK